MSDAVNASLLFHHSLRSYNWNLPIKPQVCIGIHVGQPMELEGVDDSSLLIMSHLADTTARIMSLAGEGQTLMSRQVFDDARQYVREHPAVEAREALPLEWAAHGKYIFKGQDNPVEVFEVGVKGHAPLTAPPDAEKARRMVSVEEEVTLGWRPARDLNVPGRRGWKLRENLGAGSVGEVWLAEHDESGLQHVFKFCFDTSRLKLFKRELAVLRLLRESLGPRSDHARPFEIQLDRPPFFLESEYIDSGNLYEWAQQSGRLEEIPLVDRLSLFEQTCQAVAALHSAGVVHQNIKPSNILVVGDGANTRPVLTDFGMCLVEPDVHSVPDDTHIDHYNVVTLSSTTGPAVGQIYRAPELQIGGRPTNQSDVFALGVILYQLVASNMRKPLAVGWQKDVADPSLRDLVTQCVHGDTSVRLKDANQLCDVFASVTHSGFANTLLSLDKRFYVALSFPGEHRQYVESVADALSRRYSQDRIFYDRFYEAELARPNLDVYLQAIYHDQTHLVVVFLCDDYVNKEWPLVEMRAIRNVLKQRRDDEVMFVRLDDGDVQSAGVFSVDGFIDAADRSPDQIADLIAARLCRLDGLDAPKDTRLRACAPPPAVQR